jgi:hypothetical protein
MGAKGIPQRLAIVERCDVRQWPVQFFQDQPSLGVRLRRGGVALNAEDVKDHVRQRDRIAALEQHSQISAKSCFPPSSSATSSRRPVVVWDEQGEKVDKVLTQLGLRRLRDPRVDRQGHPFGVRPNGPPSCAIPLNVHSASMDRRRPGRHTR